MKKVRLDLKLLEDGIVDDTKEVVVLILQRSILVNNIPATSVGMLVTHNDIIRIRGNNIYDYYSRAGLKLQAALNAWPDFKVAGRFFLDIGAAHGGFTQELLSKGAKQVIALDVGYGQLHPVLRQDNRVIVKERCNFYKTTLEDYPNIPDAFTIDLSFTSLEKALLHIKSIWTDTKEALVLFKPQFEADSHRLDKGIVCDQEYVQELLSDFINRMEVEYNIKVQASMPSPIKGRKGNQEYLLWLCL